MSDTLSEPAFIPEWFKRGGSSSAAGFHRGGSESSSTADQSSKRGKVLLGPEPARAGAQDGWQPRGASSGGSLGINRPVDYGTASRIVERQPSTDRSWKQRDSVAGSGPSRYTQLGKAAGPERADVPGGPKAYDRRAGPRPDGSEGGAISSRLVEQEPSWGLGRSGRDAGDGWGHHDDLRPPMGQPAAKSVFEKDFPSLGRDAKLGPPVPSAAPVPPPSTSIAPYKHEFLSARVNANWTSKLAEAPLIVGQPAGNGALPGGEQEASAVAPPAAEEVPAAAAPAVLGPAPAVPPRPGGVWGATASNAAAGASSQSASSSMAETLLGGGNGFANGANGGPSSVSNKVRMEQLAVKQSKQLIPVIMTANSKVKGKAPLAAGKPAAPAPPAVLLKMPKAREDAAPASNGPLVLTSSTVTLSKKLSQPLDKPLGRSVSATVGVSTAAVAAVVVAVPPLEGRSASAVTAAPHGPVAVQSGSLDLGVPAARQANGAVASWEEHQQQPGQAVAEQPRAAAGRATAKFHVTAEEEAFLRSLGWTEGEDDEEEEPMLTEEEIAAFKAKQVAKPPLAPSQPQAVPVRTRARKPLIVAASYGSHMDTTDSDSECE